MIKTITKSALAVTFLASTLPVFSDAKITNTIACKGKSISLGMTKEDVIKTCGQPNNEYNAIYDGHKVLKLKYIHSDKAGSALVLRFSNMESQDQLKLYKVQLTEWDDEYNPY